MGCGSSTASNSSVNHNVVIPTNGGGSRPINRPSGYVYGSPITSAELNAHRNEFWESRVDGNVDMWHTLRRVSEAILAGDVTLANVILTASNIYTPFGTLELCYDELGHEYKIPAFCYSIPVDLVLDGTVATSSPNKGPPPKKNIAGQPIKLKIRINPGDYDIAIEMDTASSIYDLKREVCEQGSKNALKIECPHERQRIIFLGRELKDTQYVDDVGFDEVKVVQVFLRPVPQTSEAKASPSH